MMSLIFTSWLDKIVNLVCIVARKCLDIKGNSVNVSVSVFGLGSGATHAVCMAELGHDVVGVNVDEVMATKLQAREVTFFESELERLPRANAVSTYQVRRGLGEQIRQERCVIGLALSGIAPN